VRRAGTEPRSARLLVVALGVAVFSYSVQQTLVVPALPTMQRDLHTTTGWISWLMSGFLLAACVTTPLAGKLGDQFGKKRVLVISLGIFLVASIAASAAPNVWVLIAARVLQGTGGGIIPLSASIVRDEFRIERVPAIVGGLFATLALGISFGMIVSGLVIDHFSWRVLFAVSSAGVALGLLLVVLVVPESPLKTPTRRDLRGALLLALGLAALMLALTEGDAWGWGSSRTVGLFAGGVAALVLWTRVELAVPEPMIDVRMLAQRPVLLTNVTAVAWSIAVFGPILLIPRFIQTPRGLSPELAAHVGYGFGATATTAGLYLMPGFLTGLLSARAAGALGRRYGTKWPLVGAAALLGIGCVSLALWHDRPWQVVAGMFAIGVGWPVGTGAITSIVLVAVRPTETGAVTGVAQVMRAIGGAIGTQVGAAILTADRIPGTSLPAERAFTAMFWVSAAAALVAVGTGLLVTPRRGRRRSALAEALG
jgi:MFS family permease